MEKSNIKIKHGNLSRLLLIYSLIYLSSEAFNLTLSNPIAFNPSHLPLIAIPPAYHPAFQGSPGAMMVASQYDPYSSIQAPYFMPASPYATPWAQLDANRRSLSSIFGSTSKGDRSNAGNGEKNKDEPTEEQKALDGLPLSFIEPDPPSTITERLSESFSALGEGFKNHFRSISENFSDTMDDIRDAWRPASANGESNGSRKRRS